MKKAIPHKTKPKRKKKVKKAFKSKAKSTSWRKFEQLVTRIEQALSPHGAIVKSPDFFIDRITNEPREVDASIRYKIGTSEIVITIECRDRIKIQDTIWIEQLATKQQNIGSSKTIAVTSNGFSEPAIKKAKFLGIEVRKVNKIDYQSIFKWAFVVRSQYNYHIINWELKIDIPEVLREKLRDKLKEQKTHIIDANILIDRTSSEETTIRKVFEDFLNRSKRKTGEIKIPESGHTDPYKIIAKIPKDRIYIKTSFGNFDLVGLTVEYTLYKYEDRTMHPVSAFTYADSKEDLVRGVEFELVSSKGTKELLSIHENLKDGKSKATVWKEDSESQEGKV